jgi:hypothetical protein
MRTYRVDSKTVRIEASDDASRSCSKWDELALRDHGPVATILP